MRNIVVVEHDPKWAERYQMEADMIRTVLSDDLVEIHHKDPEQGFGMVQQVYAFAWIVSPVSQQKKNFETMTWRGGYSRVYT